MVDRIFDQQLRIPNTFEKFNVEMKKVNIGNKEFSISNIVAGKILLPNIQLYEMMIKRMFHQDDNNDFWYSDKHGELDK